ncbi:MAG: hypothetical protein AB1665_04365 [Candidatus Thermoplasmatota archaeon]
MSSLHMIENPCACVSILRNMRNALGSSVGLPGTPPLGTGVML